MTRRLKVDLEIDFNQLKWELFGALKDFEPTGIGNPTPTFVTYDVEVLDARVVGKDASHLKLTLRKDDKVIKAIAFGFGKLSQEITPDSHVDIAYTLQENVWNNERKLELKVRDIQ